jgi:sec-independent protein translocase protein TatA
LKPHPDYHILSFKSLRFRRRSRDLFPEKELLLGEGIPRIIRIDRNIANQLPFVQDEDAPPREDGLIDVMGDEKDPGKVDDFLRSLRRMKAPKKPSGSSICAHRSRERKRKQSISRMDRPFFPVCHMMSRRLILASPVKEPSLPRPAVLNAAAGDNRIPDPAAANGFDLTGASQRYIGRKNKRQRWVAMFRGLFQPMHLLIILGIVLLIFGPGKLSQLGGALSKTVRGFRNSLNEPERPGKVEDGK